MSLVIARRMIILLRARPGFELVACQNLGSRSLDGANAPFTPVQAKNDRSFFLRRDGEGSSEYGRRIFTRVFTHDVERVLGMEVSALSTAPAHLPRLRRQRSSPEAVCSGAIGCRGKQLSIVKWPLSRAQALLNIIALAFLQQQVQKTNTSLSSFFYIDAVASASSAQRSSTCTGHRSRGRLRRVSGADSLCAHFSMLTASWRSLSSTVSTAKLHVCRTSGRSARGRGPWTWKPWCRRAGAAAAAREEAHLRRAPPRGLRSERGGAAGGLCVRGTGIPRPPRQAQPEGAEPGRCRPAPKQASVRETFQWYDHLKTSGALAGVAVTTSRCCKT